MAAGSIIIDLLMRTGSFETDTDRASKKLKQLEKDIDSAAKKIGAGLGVALVAAAAAFDQLVKSVGDFKDFEEMAGASAESFASLTTAAAGAGVQMDSIVGATVKLTKGLVGVDDESKAAGAALAALGLNVAEFKRLDPVSQYEAVGKALGNFADGANKTAVAVALFGKSGAEQLKVFKALEEQGGRNVKLTQEQIDAADAYGDAQAVAVAELKQFAQVAALQVLPVVTDTLKAFAELTKNTDALGTAGTAMRFIFDSLMVVFQTVAVVGSDVAFVLSTIGKEAGAAAAQLAALARGDLTGFKEISKAVEEDTKRARAELDKFQASIMNLGKPGQAAAADYSNEGYGKGKQLNFSGADGDADKRSKEAARARKERMAEAERDARTQAEAEEEFAKQASEAWRFYDEMQLRENKAATDAIALQWQQVFAEIDAEQERAIEEGAALIEKKGEQMSEFGKQAAANLQDFLGASLEDALAGNFDNIGDNFVAMLRKMMAQAAAAQALKALFGDSLTGGSNTGWLGQLAGVVGGFFSAGSGGAKAGAGGAAGKATGMQTVPYDGFRATLHQGEKIVPRGYDPASWGGANAGNGGRGGITIENHGADIEERPDPNGMVRLIVKMATQEIAGGIAAGTGPAAAALKSRGVNLAGGIARRA